MTTCPYEQFLRPTIRFCEEPVCSYIVEPANAWSNLIYIVVAVVILLAIRKNSGRTYFVVTLALIGVTSFVYHATNTFFGQLLDLGAMFMFSAYILILNLRRYRPKLLSASVVPHVVVGLVIFSIAAALVGPYMGLPVLGTVLFAGEIAIVLILEAMVYMRDKNYSLGNICVALVLVLLAAVAWIFDVARVWCDPATFHHINGHVMWHILTAVAAVFAAKHYVSLVNYDKS